MQDGASLFFLITASGLTLVALFAVLVALFPAALARSERAMDEAPGIAFVIGLVNLVFFGGLSLAFGGLASGLNAPIFRVPLVVALAILTILLALGLAGASEMVGGRLFPNRSRTRQVLLGGVACVLASLTPFVGWFGLFPFLSFLGLGGVILGWFRRSSATTQPATTPSEGSE